MKKLISIFLVGVILTCVFVFPASATEIEPYTVIIECPECGGLLRIGNKPVVITSTVFVDSCEYNDLPHSHDIINKTYDAHCTECSYTGKYTTREVVCW